MVRCSPLPYARRMKLLTTLTTALALFALAACHEGPAEKAGRNIDQAADKAGRSIERAGEKVRDAAK